MSRPTRGFRAEVSGLEDRLLLAPARYSVPYKQYVHFRSMTGPTPPLYSPQSSEELVSQQDSPATLILSRQDTKGSLQVRVATDPASPAVGVNVAPLDRTVTFAKGQDEVELQVPIIAGAPNPGEVDVSLTMTPLTPKVVTSGPMVLKIMASDDTIAPKIVSVEGRSDRIVLAFNKPLDPAGAANVANYSVGWVSMHNKYSSIGPLAIVMPGPWPPGTSSTWGYAPIKSAQYDPATRSVTLFMKRTIKFSEQNSFSVSGGSLARLPSKTPDPATLGPPIADPYGNLVSSYPGTSGFFTYQVYPGVRSTR